MFTETYDMKKWNAKPVAEDPTSSEVLCGKFSNLYRLAFPEKKRKASKQKGKQKKTAARPKTNTLGQRELLWLGYECGRIEKENEVLKSLIVMAMKQSEASPAECLALVAGIGGNDYDKHY